MQLKTLDDWLRHLERLHPQEIELGLDRVEKVWQQLGVADFSCPIILVGGTNGKGSTVACLESIYLQSGLKTACYTSPHLSVYNERVRLSGQMVSDKALIDAFRQIEQARQSITLTYFEFGTLAALLIFHQSAADVIILEVGLGGRLDAVNIMQPDVSIITSVALDHMEWLGDTLDSIATEKAGIARPDKPLIIAEKKTSASVMKVFELTGARVIFSGRDYDYSSHNPDSWEWSSGDSSMQALPVPALKGSYQIENCAAALAVIHELSTRLPVKIENIRDGLSKLSLPGRHEEIERPIKIILDVAHNPAAAQALADTLSASDFPGQTAVVFAMQKNRQIEPFVMALMRAVDRWYVCPLSKGEGYSAQQLSLAIKQADSQAAVIECDNVQFAIQGAESAALPGDQILVTGSFYTVAEAKTFIGI